MYKITINWYNGHCEIDSDSDFYDDVKNISLTDVKSEEDVDDLIYGKLDNLPYNHYGLFSQQTEIVHKYF